MCCVKRAVAVLVVLSIGLIGRLPGLVPLA